MNGMVDDSNLDTAYVFASLPGTLIQFGPNFDPDLEAKVRKSFPLAKFEVNPAIEEGHMALCLSGPIQN